MNKILKERLANKEERIIIYAYLETHGWNQEEVDIIDYLCYFYDDYEEYREWYFVLVA